MLARSTIIGIQTQLRLLSWVIYRFSEKSSLFDGKDGEADVLEFLTMCLEDDMVLEDLSSEYLAELLVMSIMFHIGTLEAFSQVNGTTVEDILKMYGTQLAVEDVQGEQE